MKPATLRNWMKRYGVAGVLVVAAYLLLRHIGGKRLAILGLIGFSSLCAFLAFHCTTQTAAWPHDSTRDGVDSIQRRILPKGASITLKATYGAIHWSGQGTYWGDTFVSDTRDVIIVSVRRVDVGGVFTEPTAIDMQGKEYALERLSPRFFDGVPGNEMWETWRLNLPPQEDRAIRFTIILWPRSAHPNAERAIEFVIPNTRRWRRQSELEEAVHFDRSQWLAGALSMAALNGDLSNVRKYVEQGADVNSVTQDQSFSPLACACQNNHIEVVNYLLAHGATTDPEMLAGSRTPLMAAAFDSNVTIMRLLLSNHPNLDTQDDEGWTALTYAAAAGDGEEVKLLLSQGARADLRSKKWAGAYPDDPFGRD